jgi:hypothetical protein
VAELPRLLAAVAVVAISLWGVVGLVRRSITGGTGEENGAEGWRVDDLLVLSVVMSVGTFATLTLSNNTLYGRYLDPVVIFSCVYAARVVGHLVVRVNRGIRAAGAFVWILVAAAGSTSVAAELDAQPPAPPTAQLETFLSAHHLTNGIGDYWAASVVTVDSGGSLHVRPVVANLQHLISPDGRQAPLSWYQGEHYSFIVYERAPYGRVDAATVLHTFGTARATYEVGRYTVDTFTKPIELHTAPFPKPQ